MPRSCRPSPSFSHFLAMEVVRIGQSVLESIQLFKLPAQGALSQVQVLGFAHFEIGGAARWPSAG